MLLSGRHGIGSERASFGLPRPPVGWPHIDADTGLRVHPAAEGSPAGEDQRVLALLVKHGKLKIPEEGGAGYGLPHLSR